MTIQCYKCGENKKYEDFFKNKNRKNGLDHTCKQCKKEYAIEYRIKNKLLIADKRKKHYLNNKEKVKSQKKKYSDNNTLKIKTQKRQYYLINKNTINNRSKKYNSENKERLKSYYKNYNTIYSNKRRKNDLNFKLRSLLRTRMIQAIKNNQKSGHTIEILGCTIEEFKKHLEQQFKDGMTWQNHGFGKNKWNIDHIIPCASFDLSDPIQQKKCFHYTNVQPLWHFENIKKGDRIIPSPTKESQG